MSDTTTAFVPEFAIFMLVKTTPEWLAFPVDRRFELLREQVTPILERHKADVRLRFFDCEFYSARVTDLWMWEARSHHSYQLVVEALRETAFWDRYFEVVEILTGIEDAYAKNYEREPIGV